MPAAILAFNGLTWSRFGAAWSPDALDDHQHQRLPSPGLRSSGSRARRRRRGARWAFDKSPTRYPGKASLRPILIRDIPVTGGAPADRLGFAQLVLALARFVDNRETEPPVSCWRSRGRGARASPRDADVQGELEPTGRFRFAWFNAWEHQDRDKILAAFLRTVGRQLKASMARPWHSVSPGSGCARRATSQLLTSSRPSC